jgi:hypothetical protein
VQTGSNGMKSSIYFIRDSPKLQNLCSVLQQNMKNSSYISKVGVECKERQGRWVIDLIIINISNKKSIQRTVAEGCRH